MLNTGIYIFFKLLQKVDHIKLLIELHTGDKLKAIGVIRKIACLVIVVSWLLP